jgi:hypothetical protein
MTAPSTVGPSTVGPSTVRPGGVGARPGPTVNFPRLLTAPAARRRAHRLTGVGAATAVLCVALAGATNAGPAYAAGGSWLNYVNAQAGRSCTVETSPGTAAGVTSAKETMRLLSKSQTAAGTVLHYRTVTSAGTAGKVNTVTTDSTWEIFGNGSVGLPPGFSGSAGGYTVTFGGSELFPSLGQLHAGQTATRALTVTLAASTGQAGAYLAELAANGKSLTLQITVKASLAPTVGSISTPGGTFNDPVGVVTSILSIKPLNGSAILNKTWPLLSSTFSQLLTSTMYFAPGVGPVKFVAPGAHLTLESVGCRG